MSVEFKDNTMQVIGALKDNITAFLYEAAGELEAQVKRNTRVDTGQLKASWKYVVEEDKLKATIGSPLQNAIWEEFGTGEHAENGKGRKTPWRYQDVKGNWYTTKGKKPSRALHKAIITTRPKIEKRLSQIIEKGNK